MGAFGKPQKKGDDFEFQLPDEMSTGGRGRIPAKKDYPGRLTDIVADTSKAGNPMWVWTFVITKGDHAGRDFKMWTVLTDDAAWKIVETMKALGVEYEAGEKISINKKQLIGTGCLLSIVDDEFDGNETSSLKRIFPDPRGAGFKSGLGGKAAQEEEGEDGEGEGNEGEDEPAPPKKKTSGGMKRRK